MTKSKSSKKSKSKQEFASDKKKTRRSFEEFISQKIIRLIIALIYFVLLGIISFVFHKVGDYGIETDFF